MPSFHSRMVNECDPPPAGDGVHFDDLTKINVPFALLNDDTRDRLVEARRKGVPIQAVGFYGMWNLMVVTAWENPITYRVSPDWKPAPIPPSVPWHLFKPEWRFHARDQNGGAFLFVEKPERREYTWVADTSDCRIDSLKDYAPGTVGWENSLLERPEGL